MRLEDFPRPKDDNGRGVHWSARLYHPRGPELDFWIAELQAMKIKWVKVLDDSGGSSLELCQRLLAADIMPIVRLYREAPNPGHIGGREEDTLSRLIAAGVRYFETNNEPDLPAEWKGGYLPENWLDIVVDNFIYDADRIIAMGGLPALPAMSPGKKHDALALVVRKGRGDLFEKGAWIAIHNYTLNHPLDYPYDDVNVHGKPLTQEEYDAALREEVVPESPSFAWDNQPIELINQWRAADKNPDASLEKDPSCFLAYILANEAAVSLLGFPVPVISTEAGPVVNWRDDRRYPRVSPRLHRDWLVRIFQFMQEQAPPWYFAVCPWLLASYRMGDFNPTWEQMSWYTNWYDRRFGLHGELPAVAALKALPSRPRVAGGTAILRGVARSQAGKPIADLNLTLQKDGRDVAYATTGADGTFLFASLASGTYDLAYAGRIVHRGATVTEGQVTVLELTLSGGERSLITGRVRDVNQVPRTGVLVELRRDGALLNTAATETNGRFAFTGLTAGTYWVDTEGAMAAQVVLDGWDTAEVELIVPAAIGFRYRVITKRLLPREETANRSSFFGRVLDAGGNGLNGVRLRMTWTNPGPGTQFPETRSGQDPFKPAGNYEFIHTAGEFQIQVVQGDWPSDVADGLITVGIPGRENDIIAYEVNFQLQPVGEAEARESRVEGQVPGGHEGQRLFLRHEGTRWTTTLDPSGRFAFTDLGAGTYSLELENIGIIEPAIALDGRNVYSVIFPLLSRIQGRVIGGVAGETAVLASDTWSWTREATLGADGRYLFEGLPRGTYRVRVSGREVGGLQVDGRSQLTAPDIDLLAQRRSALRGRITDASGLPQPERVVLLYQDDTLLMRTVTDAEGRFAFTGLGPGAYRLDVEGVGMNRSPLMLDGDDEKDVEMRLPLAAASRPIAHYVLFGPANAVGTRAALLLAQPYLRKTGALGGFSLQEAARAVRVTIVGDGITAEDQAELIEAGCQVERLSGDAYALEKAFARLLAD